MRRARRGLSFAGACAVAALGLGAVASVATSCTSDGDDARAKTATATIGPAGGSLTLGSVTLTIPPGALERDEAITLTELAGPPPGFEALSPQFRFEPSGLRFKQPATVTFRTAGGASVGEVAWSGADESTLAELDTTQEGDALSARVDHFSRGCAVVSTRCGSVGKACCRSAGCKGGLTCDASTKTCQGGASDAGDGGARDAATDGYAPLHAQCRVHIAGPDRQYITKVAVDKNGDIAVAGWFYGSADFGGGVLTSAGGGDAFVAKYDASCKHVWSKRFGDAADQQFTALQFDSASNILVVGVDVGRTDYGTGAQVEGNGQVVAKFDGSGTAVWAKKWVSSVRLDLNSLALGPGDEIVLLGRYEGSLTFGATALFAAPVGYDSFVAKLSSSGDEKWAKSSTGVGPTDKDGGLHPRDHQFRSAVVSPSGDIFATGIVSGLADVGGGPLGNPQPASRSAAVIASFDATGSHRWSRVLAPGMADDVTMTSFGSLVVSARPLPSANALPGDYAPAIVQLTMGGANIATKDFSALPGGQRVIPNSLVIGEADTITYSGYFRGPLNLGGATFTSDKPDADAGFRTDIFVARFDLAGNHLWSAPLGGPGDQYNSSLARGPAGSIVLAGSFYGTIDLLGASFTSVDQDDAFLVKLVP